MNPSIGMTVHFMNGSVHYPAIITHVYGGYQPACVDITVFSRPNDPVYDVPVVQVTCVGYQSMPTHGTWHWPEQEDVVQDWSA